MTHNVPEASERVTFAARAERYARQVVEGEIVAGKWTIAACQRNLDDLARSESDPDWPYVFDANACGRVCKFLQLMPHVKGEDARAQWIDGQRHQPRLVLQDWQVFCYGVPFGWLHRETGKRRFQWVYLEVARKNGKSTPAAGLALYLTGADGEPGAEVYSLATKKDQARIVWDVAKQMMDKDPAFFLAPPHGLGMDYSSRAIFQPHTASKYEPLGRDSDTKDGFNTHAFVADELHAWKDRNLWGVMESSMGARTQPMGIAITTAGFNPSGVCYEQRDYLSRVLNSTLLAHGGMGYRVQGDALQDDTLFGVIYTLDDSYADDHPSCNRDDDGKPKPDDWADEATWPKANPNLGISVSLKYLQDRARKAMASPQSRAEFQTKHCNQWLAADTAFMDMAAWDRCADTTLSEDDFAGEDCWCALDAAFKTDFFSRAKLFRRGEHYYAFTRHWLPELKIDAHDAPQFWAWAQEGLITPAPGAVIDIELIRDDIEQAGRQHQLREVPFDPYQLTQFASEMLEDGVPMVEMRATVQNFSEPMKFLLELVLEGKFHHDGDPVLRWMIANVVCHRDAKDNIYPRKIQGQEETRKIDGAIALIMALGRAMVDAGQVKTVKQGFVDLDAELATEE